MSVCSFSCSAIHRPLFALCDQTFAKGRVGLWTKSDAVTYFNDLRLETAP
ncbi:MAG: hypothetical protein U0236_15760 [Nitrospira sp.]